MENVQKIPRLLLLLENYRCIVKHCILAYVICNMQAYIYVIYLQCKYYQSNVINPYFQNIYYNTINTDNINGKQINKEVCL